MKGSVRQTILELLPAPLALQLYLMRNKPYLASGYVMPEVKLDLYVPQRNSLWIERIESGKGHETGICEMMACELADTPDFIYCDVGSCFGFFPALLSEIKPNIQIFAFEAGWQQFHFLKKNQAIYASKNRWTIEQKYVGATTDDSFVCLDDYFQKRNLTPSVIQIDVDGYENEVLKGCRRIIDSRQTKFLLELHPLILHKYQTSIEAVLHHFKGYTMKILTDIREGNNQWSDKIEKVYTDDNPYLLISPQ